MTKHSSSTWILLGAGNFFHDLAETIVIIGGKLIGVVTNQPLPVSVRQAIPSSVPLYNIKEAPLPKADKHFFGFINSNKSAFEKEYIAAYQQYHPGKTPHFANLIHPSAVVSPSATMGKGNYIGAGVVIGPQVRLGDFCIINRGVTVGHDVKVGSYTHLAPAATICGRVSIGESCLLGANCTVIDGLKITDNCTIGAGAVVTKDLSVAATYVGVPAQRRA